MSPDEWITRFYGADIAGEALDAVRDPVENALWELAARVLVLGLDVILEYGFWSKSERIEYREKAKQLGVRSELHFLDVPEEELLRRLSKRNTQLPPGAFWIDETRLQNWVKLFQSPDADELHPWEV